MLGAADLLISGDKDLLVLKRYEGSKIVSPSEFVGTINNS